MDPLTITELDMLVDGVTAWEHMQPTVPTFVALTAQEAQGPFEAEKNAQKALQREMRGRMEAATLLKAKLINEKTVVQAAGAIADGLAPSPQDGTA